jgi:hypothetical protein
MLVTSGIALLMTPLVMWAIKPGGKILIAYGSALFVLLAVVILAYPPFGLYGSVLLAIAGLVLIGFQQRYAAKNKGI